MKGIMLIGFSVLVASGAAQAIGPGPSSATQKSTEDWLQLQVNGRAASTNPQPAKPAERDAAMQRWLDSFKYPIPEFYEQKKGGSVSGSSGGS